MSDVSRRSERTLSADELVDWIDTDGSVIEVVTRSRLRVEHLRHWAVFIMVRSTSGEVLVHQRSMDKDLWPGFWDICVGGVVGTGEPLAEAAVREVAEEIGVVVTTADLRPLGQSPFDNDDVSLIGEVFEIINDGPFTFADGEVIQARFVSVAELESWLGDLHSTRQWVPDSIELLGHHLGLSSHHVGLAPADPAPDAAPKLP
jgi:8-oxo-dGTP pyrophosphatase MutT (NUDIX family)